MIREGAAGPVSLTLDQTDLVWASDRDTFFGNYAPINHNTIPEYRGGRELVKNISQDELFMGWMRPAAHPSAGLDLYCHLRFTQGSLARSASLSSLGSATQCFAHAAGDGVCILTHPRAQRFASSTASSTRTSRRAIGCSSS